MSELPPMAMTASGGISEYSLPSTKSELADVVRGYRHLIHFDAKGGEGIFDSRGHHGWHGNGACLTRAFYTQRIDRRWRFDVIHLQVRHLGSIGDQEIHVTGIEQLAVVVIIQVLIE